MVENMDNKKKLTKEEKRNFISILTIATLFFVVMLFVNVFLVARIFYITNENFVAIGLFVIMQASGMFLSYFSTSVFCKKYKPVYVTRLLAVLSIVFLVMLYLFQEYLGSYYMLFGLCWGLIFGIYAGSTNLMIARLFKAKGSHNFVTWRKMARGGVSILFPFTLGLLIDLGSFTMSIVVVGVISVMLVIATIFVRYPKEQSTKLQPIKYFHAMRDNGATRQTMSLWFICLMATSFNMLSYFTTMLIILSIGSNIGLGAMHSVIGAVGILSLFAYHKSPKSIKTKMFWFSAVVPFLVSLILFFDVNITLVIIFFFLTSFKNIVSAEEMPLRMNATKFWGGEEFMVESNIFLELPAFLGKVIGGTCIIIVGLVGPTTFMLAGMVSAILFIFYIHAVMVFFWKRKYVYKTPATQIES